ncbi:RTA1 like protein-domain-containing protein [Lipomyces arxii]|uniref:RTA1 like protein-domain-containing protein n=1 Tax=Lipomyces arxii TaxID=56418 RepID=UPI0034CECA95
MPANKTASKDLPFDYVPLTGPNLAALIIFAIAWIMHTGLGWIYRKFWFMGCMFITMGLETAGYIGRYIAHTDPYNKTTFLLQIVCLTFAPAFFMAGIYYLLGEIVVVWGVRHSRVSPWTYSKVFICLDLFSILLQGAGGGIASSAESGDPIMHTGTYVMIGGLGFQVLVTAFFFIVCADYFFRVRRRSKQVDVRDDSMISEESNRFAHVRNSRLAKTFIVATFIATVLIFARSIYRVIELSYGWNGYLMTEEGYFLVLDTLMVSIASLISWIFYPALFLGCIDVSYEHRIALSSDIPLSEFNRLDTQSVLNKK